MADLKLQSESIWQRHNSKQVRHAKHVTCRKHRPRSVLVLGVGKAGIASRKIQLGRSNLQVSKIGIGTLQWGDPGQGFGSKFNEAELEQVFSQAVDGGINFFDTAEVYGYQGIKSGSSSEAILGRCIAKSDAPLVVGTKFFTIPWTNALVGGGFRIGRAAILEALTASLQRLGKIDVYQVHFPFPTYPQQVLADALTEVVQQRGIEAVGVCNYSLRQMEELHSLLDKRGIPLATNQVKFSALERGPLQFGLLDKCKELGVQLVAHSPLSQGLLTGKQLLGMLQLASLMGIEAENVGGFCPADKYVGEGGGKRGESIRPLLKLMQFIGAVSGGRSVAQVALNYLVAHGAIPIPGAKSVQQVQDHIGALDWKLEENEREMITEKCQSLIQ